MTDTNLENNDVLETPVEDTQATEESKTVENQDEYVQLSKEEYARLIKEKDDFKKATFKYKELAKGNKTESSKSEEPKTQEPTQKYMTEDDFVLRTNNITAPEDRNFVKAFAKSSEISIEEALRNSVVTGELARRNEERNTAKASEGLGDGAAEEAFLTDKQFIKEFEAKRIEITQANLDKYMDLTRAERLSS